jgi:hypothetical protein
MALPPSRLSSNLTLEVSDVPKVTQVTRGGLLVRAPNLDNENVAGLIDRLVPPPRTTVPRVVSQSVPAGTLVQQGTAVDLVLVSPVDVTFEVFGKVHPALLTKNVASVLTAMPTPVATIVNAKADPATLTAAERDTVTQFLNTQHVATAGGTAENAFESVYGRLVDIQVFK